MRAPLIDRIGLAIGADALRAVGVRQRRVAWALEQPVAGSALTAADVLSLLERAPLRRWPAPRVLAAVGPSRAQTKKLAGLPASGDIRLLSRVVHESAARFFLKAGVTLTTTGLRRTGSGDLWGAAIEAVVVEAVQRACRARRLRLDAIVPTVVALGHVDRGARMTWRDGDGAIRIEFAGAELRAVHHLLDRGTASDAAPPEPQPLPVELARLGGDALRYLDAYAAALTPPAETMAYRPGSPAPDGARVPAWRIAVPAGAVVLLGLAAALAPGAAADLARRSAEARLVAVSDRRHEAIALRAELSKVSAALQRVAVFEASRQRGTEVLAALAQALPEGAAMTSIRLDSAGGTATFVAPRVSSVLAGLENAGRFAAPEILGPVTRELVGSSVLERVTVRFRVRAATSGDIVEASR